MNRNDVAVEDDSSDKEPVRRIKKKEEPVSKNSKDRTEHVNIQLRWEKFLLQQKFAKKPKLMQNKLKRIKCNKNGNQVVSQFREEHVQQLLKVS